MQNPGLSLERQSGRPRDQHPKSIRQIYLAKAQGNSVQNGQEPPELTGNSFSPPVNVIFTYSDGKIQVKKQFSFSDRYSVKSSVSVFDGLHYLPVEVAWPGGFGDQTLSASVASMVERGVYETADEAKVREVTLTPSFFSHIIPGGGGTGASASEQDIPGPLVFAGLEDRFFAGCLSSQQSRRQGTHNTRSMDPFELAG